MINNNLRLVKESITKATRSLDDGARAARDEMMTALIQLTQEEIKGERYYFPSAGKSRYYAKATSGEPPQNRTGRLRRSIHGEKFNVGGFDGYEAIVGPGVVYGRALENGGDYAPPSWKDGQRFPYMAPAFRKFQSVAPMIIRKHLGFGGG